MLSYSLLQTNATLLLQEIIENAPPDENLFVIFAEMSRRLFFPIMPSSYTPQLKILSGIFALEFLLMVASLGVRAMNPSAFWVCQRTKTPDGSYITPHFAVAWQLASAGFLLAAQGIIWVGVKHAEGHYVPNFVLWEALPFIPSYISAWCLSWSLYVAQSVGSHARKPHWSTSPLFLNFHFCCLVLIVPLVIGLAAWANADYERVYRMNKDLQERALSLATLGGGLPREQAVKMIYASAPTVQIVLDGFSHYISLFRAAWIVWLAGTAYIYLIFCVIALRYFAYLRSEFRRVEQTGPRNSDQSPVCRTRAIRSAFWNALWTCLCVTTVGVVFTAASFGVVFATRRVVVDGDAFNLVVLSTMWTFGICAFVACVLSLFRSLEGMPSRHKVAFVFQARSSSRAKTADLRDFETDLSIVSHFRSDGRVHVQGVTSERSELEACSEDRDLEAEGGSSAAEENDEGGEKPSSQGRRKEFATGDVVV